jgi:ubiquinone/menaquinone biosynthesis C-methylase UbiE
MSIAESYNEWSSTYDTNANRTRDLDAQLMREMFAERSFGSVLEIGCGTGKNTAMLAGVCNALMAVDLSPGMLAHAKCKVTAAHVRFALADIRLAWPVADSTTDLVTCNLVLEHLESLSHVFAEARRALRTGGTFFVCELHPCRQYAGSQAKFTKDGETIPVQAFTHHLSDFVAVAMHLPRAKTAHPSPSRYRFCQAERRRDACDRAFRQPH